jgi:hypothetical protein
LSVAEQVERLAHHALRGEVWDKALAYCRQAGERALARSAYREVVGYFEQALSALPHLPERRDTHEQAIDLRLAIGSGARRRGLERFAGLRSQQSDEMTDAFVTFCFVLFRRCQSSLACLGSQPVHAITVTLAKIEAEEIPGNLGP